MVSSKDRYDTHRKWQYMYCPVLCPELSVIVRHGVKGMRSKPQYWYQSTDGRWVSSVRINWKNYIRANDESTYQRDVTIVQKLKEVLQQEI